METVLYLIRHGETEWNLTKRYQGQSDIPLNTPGIRQAERLAAWYQEHAFDHIYASDLSRAFHTAHPLASKRGMEITTLSMLRERSYGQWEGMTYEEVRSAFAEVDTDTTIYGIEPMVDLRHRARAVMEEIARKHLNEKVAVISHGGFINAFLYVITEGKQGTGITRIDNTGVTTLRFTNDGWRVLQVNDTAHLES